MVYLADKPLVVDCHQSHGLCRSCPNETVFHNDEKNILCVASLRVRNQQSSDAFRGHFCADLFLYLLQYEGGRISQLLTCIVAVIRCCTL